MQPAALRSAAGGADRASSHALGWCVSAAALVAVLAARPTLALGLVAVAVLFVPLERLAPLHRRPVLRPGWSTDTVHFIVNNLAGTALTVAAVVVLYVPLRLLALPPLRTATGQQPGWLQIVEALVFIELVGYWAHRASHVVPLLWRFHRVHHSSQSLDWLAAARVHPVDQAWTRAVTIAPLAAAGFHTVSLGAAAGLLLLLAIGVHANVRLRIPVLRWVITTPEFHHWHHANQPEAINRNFASALPAVDALFGTAHMPRGRAPDRYGIDEAIGDTWAEHMASPVRGRRDARQGW